MNHADIAVALTSKKQKLSALQIQTDIVMNSLYPLTYLLFKHGTLCNRRVNEVSKLFIYRTLFLGIIISVYMCLHGFSASLPIKRLMLILFIVVVSPTQIVLHGLSFKNVGFDYVHRIYGEYKRNALMNMFTRYNLIEMFLNAILDAIVFYLFSSQRDYFFIPSTGRQFTSEGFQLYQGIILYILFTFQLTN